MMAKLDNPKLGYQQNQVVTVMRPSARLLVVASEGERNIGFKIQNACSDCEDVRFFRTSPSHVYCGVGDCEDSIRKISS